MAASENKLSRAAAGIEKTANAERGLNALTKLVVWGNGEMFGLLIRLKKAGFQEPGEFSQVQGLSLWTLHSEICRQ